YARLVAERFGTEHHEMVLTPDIGELAVRLLAHADEPLADTSLFPTYLVSAFARQSVTVALSGDGGDEIFAGYDWYAAQKAARYYGLLPGALRGRLLPALLDRVPPSEAKKGLANVSKRFVAGANRPADLEHARWLVYLDPEERERFYAPGFLAEVGAFDPLGVLRRHFADAGTSDPLARQIYVDLKTFLVDDIMVKVDRMSMATSLEARAPFLDHEVVEFAASLPSRLKMRGFERKYLLKRAFADLLPEAILRRDKQGFSSPVKNWLRAELRPMLLDVVSPERLRAEGYVEPAYVERLVREHLAGTHDHGHRLWALVVFGLWHEQYRTGSGWAPEARLGRDALKYGAAAVAD
ncbi:MAG: hypothetical protein IRY97_10885, partial [Thermomicrobiaceae bacterium]|nr:hypothetical protein [Thermomicrobiaceae bacterium]